MKERSSQALLTIGERRVTSDPQAIVAYLAGRVIEATANPLLGRMRQ